VRATGVEVSVLDQWYAPHVTEERLLAFDTQVRPRDIVEKAFLERDLDVAHQSELVEREVFERSATSQDRPAGIDNATFMRARFGGPQDARVWITGGAGTPFAPDPERMSAARAVLPALKAALAAWDQVGARQSEMGRLLDAAGGSIIAVDARGHVLHETAATTGLLAEESPADAVRVRDGARQFAFRLHATLRSTAMRAREPLPDATLRTGRQRFELTGTVSHALLGRDPIALVALRRVTPAPLSDDALRQRFDLTPREIEVARLIGEGLSNREIGERLGVQFYTARNHVERVLGKLSVPNRARVGAVLRGSE
jgi:DNA-binding CsgD family transcriptional regulator